MPNMPALVGQGMSAISFEFSANEVLKKTVLDIFAATGLSVFAGVSALTYPDAANIMAAVIVIRSVFFMIIELLFFQYTKLLIKCDIRNMLYRYWFMGYLDR